MQKLDKKGYILKCITKFLEEVLVIQPANYEAYNRSQALFSSLKFRSKINDVNAEQTSRKEKKKSLKSIQT